MSDLFVNHHCLAGIARLSEAQARGRITALAALIRNARAVGYRRNCLHPSIFTVEAAPGLSLAKWIESKRGIVTMADATELLARVCNEGPFTTDLGLAVLGQPSDCDPSVSNLAPWKAELILTALHSMLAGAGSGAAMLSFLDPDVSAVAAFQVQRQASRAVLTNIRSSEDMAALQKARVMQGLKTTAEVLEAAAAITPNLVVLETARRSAKHWTLDCSPDTLFTTINSLTVYGAALGAGSSREEAALAYYKASQVEMSGEKAQTLKPERLRKQRTFTLPTGEDQLFDMHAKPGAKTRVHVYSRPEGDDEKKIQMVYVGWCGEHRDLK